MADKVKIIFKSGQTNSPAQQTDGAYTVPLSDGQVLFYYNKDASTGDVYSAGEIYYDKLVDGTVKRMKMGAIADRATYDKSGTDIEDYVFNLNFTTGANNFVITPVSGAGKSKAAVTIPGASVTLAGLVTINAQTFAGAKTFNGVVHVNNATAVALNNAHGLAIGALNASNLGFDGAHIQARNNGAASTLNLNSLGGQVVIGSGGLKVNGAIYDSTGREIKDNFYIASIAGATGGSTYVITPKNRAGTNMSAVLTIPAATTAIAGLVSTGAQNWAGDKNLTGNITLIGDLRRFTFKPSNSGPWNILSLYKGDTTGAGLVFGQVGGRVIIGAGESADALHTELGVTEANEAEETLHLASDGNIYIHTNCQTIANRKTITIDTNGSIKLPTTGEFYDKNGSIVRADLFVNKLTLTRDTTKYYVHWWNTAGKDMGNVGLEGATTALAGLVTTGAQSFAGAKTFTSNTTISGTLTMGNNIIFPGAYGVYWNGAQKFKIVAKYGTSSTTGYLCIQGTSSLTDYIRIREDGQVQILNSANTELLDKNSQILRANLFLAKLELTTTGTTNVITAKNTANGVLSTITLNGADTGKAGLVTTGDQTWAGNKRFINQIFIQPTSGTEGGELHLGAADSNKTHSGIILDQIAPGQFRIFGIPSADGITRKGTGQVFGIDPYAPSISANEYTMSLKHLVMKANEGTIKDKNGREILSALFVNKLTTTRDANKYLIHWWNEAGADRGTAEIAGADASNAGLVTTGTQIFAGSKTFMAQITGNIVSSNYARSLEEKKVKTNYYTYLETHSNIHPYERPEEITFVRNFISDGSNITDYNTPTIDNHSLVMSIDSSQIYIRMLTFDIRSEDIYTNARTNNGWLGWRKLLDSVNYTNYTVNKNGLGATGNWNINITGNAATASRLTPGKKINTIMFDGTADIQIPRLYENGVDRLYVSSSDANYPLYLRIKHDASGNLIDFGVTAAEIPFFHFMNSSTNKFWSSDHFYLCPSTTGQNASGTWNISITGNAVTANFSQALQEKYMNNTNFYTYLETTGNLHPYSANKFVTFRNFCNNIDSGTATLTTYNAPCTDSHSIAFGLDGSCNYVRILSFDIRTNDIYVNSRSNKTWLGWRKLLDSVNYTNYTVTKTGGGASGTWPISISGNASTATKWQTARQIRVNLASSTAQMIDGTAAKDLSVFGILSIVNGGTARTDGYAVGFINGNSKVNSGTDATNSYIMANISNSTTIKRWDIGVNNTTGRLFCHYFPVSGNDVFDQIYTIKYPPTTISGNAGSSNWTNTIDESRQTNVNIKTYIGTVSNIHPYSRSNEIRFVRFYADSFNSYNLPCVDTHNMILSIDNNINHVRILSFDIRTPNIYTASRVGGTNNWSEWKKVYTQNNIIYSSSQPSGCTAGDIWLKPAT